MMTMMITMTTVLFGGQEIKTLSHWPITKVVLELIIFSSPGKWNLLCWILDHQQTMGRIVLTWLHAEQVGGGGGGRKWRVAAEETNIHQIVSISLGLFLCTQVLPSTVPQQTGSRYSFQTLSKKLERREASSTSSRAFPIVSGNAIVPIQRCRKEGALGIQAISLHRVKLFQFRIQAFVPVAQHWELETTLCVIATLRRALWYVHLLWLVLQIALMSLPPCLCSLASSHWSSPGCTTAQP